MNKNENCPELLQANDSPMDQGGASPVATDKEDGLSKLKRYLNQLSGRPLQEISLKLGIYSYLLGVSYQDTLFLIWNHYRQQGPPDWFRKVDLIHSEVANGLYKARMQQLEDKLMGDLWQEFEKELMKKLEKGPVSSRIIKNIWKKILR